MKHGVLYKGKSHWYLQLQDPETDLFDKGFVRSKRKADVMKTAERWLYGSDGYIQCIDQLHIYDGIGRWRKTIASVICRPEIED
jgi:hypothetical protein